MVSAVCSPSLWQFRYETCLILRKRLENLARYTSAVTYCIGFVFSFLGTYVYIYMHIKSSMICLMISRGKKQANLTENNLLEVWRLYNAWRHYWKLTKLTLLECHWLAYTSWWFFGFLLCFPKSVSHSQNLSRTATTTASLDLSGNSPYKTWAFWRFCPENEPNSAKMGGLQVPHSIHSKFPLWSGGRVNLSHMMIGPKWDFLPLGSFFQRKHTVFQRGAHVRTCDECTMWPERGMRMRLGEFMVGPAN